MDGRLNTIIVILLVASLAHLPVPVWDGDDIGSQGGVAGATFNACDIDMILLGCDLPEDCDDGPTDDDPDDGTLDAGLGPAYRAAASVEPLAPTELSFREAGVSGDAMLPARPDPQIARWDGPLAHAARPRPATTVLRL